LDRKNIARPLTAVFNGVAYPTASVKSAYIAQSFRRIYDDRGDYACYQADMALTWVTAGDRLDESEGDMTTVSVRMKMFAQPIEVAEAESARSGPEFQDASRGGYELDRIGLRGDDLASVDLKPAALKEFILELRQPMPRGPHPSVLLPGIPSQRDVPGCRSAQLRHVVLGTSQARHSSRRTWMMQICMAGTWRIRT
jgi:hypothetical protein